MSCLHPQNALPMALQRIDSSSGLCLRQAFPQDIHLHDVRHVRHPGAAHAVELLFSYLAAVRTGYLERAADRTCDVKSSEFGIAAGAVERLAVVLAVEDS